MSSENQARVHAGTNAMQEEIALQELREALNFTQEQVAESVKLI
jgi:DNA-binding XRE family transcriptional regulator